MRWELPRNGEVQIFSGFLFLPKRIGNELRWLEFAKYKAHYYFGEWIPDTWIN
jgi:hypothetical protein